VSPNVVKRMIELARGRGVLEDATVRQAIADLHSRMQIMIWSATQRRRADRRRIIGQSGDDPALLRCRELGYRSSAPTLNWQGAATDGWPELVVFPAPAITAAPTRSTQHHGERGPGDPAIPARCRRPPPTPPADRPTRRRRQP
jgi:hypothetical protein